jgi:hypothetical protein
MSLLRRAPQALLLVGLASFMGCADELPSWTQMPTPDGGTQLFVDTVISYSVGGVQTTCTSSLPVCGTSPQMGPCGNNPVLGPNDGMSFTLHAGDRIDLEFLCGMVVNRNDSTGQPTPDLRIWSTVPSNGAVLVEVSADGAAYETLGQLSTSNEAFDLGLHGLDAIQYVRLTGINDTGVQIDAVEGL